MNNDLNLGGTPPPQEPAENQADNGAGSALIVDTTTQSFMGDVVEASKTQLVLVDFWAPWCGPCKQLTPVLEKLVQQAGGAVKLAKMNIDEHPQIAQQLQVQSIPAVFAFKNGQPVDGFMGALPESELKAFIEKNLDGALGPSDFDKLYAAGKAALEAQDYGKATEFFSAALDLEADNPDALIGLAQTYLAIDAGEAAHEILASIPPAHANNPDVLALKAQLELAEKAEEAGDIENLLAALAENENDHQARFDLALAYHASNQREEAVDALLAIIEKQANWNDDAARKQLIELFDAYGAMDEVTQAGRRRLSSLLFS
ncbi:MAG: thioredoxin [Parvibaculales bacterium]